MWPTDINNLRKGCHPWQNISFESNHETLIKFKYKKTFGEEDGLGLKKMHYVTGKSPRELF